MSLFTHIFSQPDIFSLHAFKPFNLSYFTGYIYVNSKLPLIFLLILFNSVTSHVCLSIAHFCNYRFYFIFITSTHPNSRVRMSLMVYKISLFTFNRTYFLRHFSLWLHPPKFFSIPLPKTNLTKYLNILEKRIWFKRPRAAPGELFCHCVCRRVTDTRHATLVAAQQSAFRQ